MDLGQAREDAFKIFDEAVEAANPKKCILNYVNRTNNLLSVSSQTYDLDKHKSVYAIAIGKAAGSMAEAIEELLGDRLSGGLVVSNTRPEKTFNKLGFYLSSHPVPNEKS